MTAGAGRAAAKIQLSAAGSFRIQGLPSCFENDCTSPVTLPGTIVTQLEGDYVLELLLASGPFSTDGISG
jgi:hypothetical protein